jgi:hypothetical protein
LLMLSKAPRPTLAMPSVHMMTFDPLTCAAMATESRRAGPSAV